MAFTLDGAFLYVANQNTNNVSVIDTATNTVTATVGVGTGPVAVAMSTVPAPLTVAAPDVSLTEGSSVPVGFTPSYSGLLGSDTQPTTPPVCTTTATSSSPPGTYPITCSGVADPRYAIITYRAGTFTITPPAALGLSVSNVTSVYGQPVAVTATVSGLSVAGTVSFTADGQPVAACTGETLGLLSLGGQAGCTLHLRAGTHTIDATATTVLGTLTHPVTLAVAPAHLVVTASSASVAVGAALPNITPGYSGLANGDTASWLTTAPTCTATASSSSPAGTYATSCSGAADPNYTISYVAGTLTLQGFATPGKALPVTGGPSWTLVGLAALCYLLGGLALGASSGQGLRGRFAVIGSSLWRASPIGEGAGTAVRSKPATPWRPGVPQGFWSAPSTPRPWETAPRSKRLRRK